MDYKPRGLTFDQCDEGDAFVCPARPVPEADTVNFAGVSGDYNPLRTDEEFGKTTPFGSCSAPGALGLAIATGQANQLGVFEGTTIALININVNGVAPGATKTPMTATIPENFSSAGSKGCHSSAWWSQPQARTRICFS
jgi:hypothetical protein